MINSINLDPLTGLYNRNVFFESIRPLTYLAKRKNHKVGIMLMDIDDFKIFNDKFGHAEGDKALQTISSLLKSHLRTSDILGRYGGGEFIVYFSAGDNPDSVYILCEKLLKTIHDESDKIFPVTFSVGICQKRINLTPEEEIDYLIRKANENLLRAKKEGKNRVYICDC